MNRRKKLTIMAAVLAAACAATGIAVSTEKHTDSIKNTGEIVMNIDPSSVDSLSWKYNDTELSYHKEDRWVCDSDDAFPVSEDKINELLSVFENLGASFIIEEPEDLGQYGLSDPVCTIDIGAGEDSYNILLGSFSTMDNERYLSNGDGNVYLVKTDPFESYEITLKDTIENDVIPSFDTIRSVAFTGKENYELFYEENSTFARCDEDRYYTEQGGDTTSLDTDLVESYCKAVSYEDLTEYASYNVTEEELKSYGLDDPALSVKIAYTSKNTEGNNIDDEITVHLGQNPEERAKKEKAEEEDKEYDGSVSSYLRVNDSPIVYKISESDYNKLSKASFDDLRHQKLFFADFADVTQIDISLDGESYTITSKEPGIGEDERTYYYEDNEIDITNLRTCIKALTSSIFTEEAPAKQEEISLTLHMDDANYPEIKLQLYRDDGVNCLAAADGRSVCLVSRSSVVDLVEAVHSLIL